MKINRSSAYRIDGDAHLPMRVEFYRNGEYIGAISSVRSDRVTLNDLWYPSSGLADVLEVTPDAKLSAYEWFRIIRGFYRVSQLRVDDSYLEYS